MQLPESVSIDVGSNAESLADLRMRIRHRAWLKTGAFKNISIEIPQELGQFAPIKVDVIAVGTRLKAARKQVTVSG